MSRHRNVRGMNYYEEYNGYDDVYGHSDEDDYCVSPSAEQFMFDRSKQYNISSFFTQPDIVEVNEEEEEIPSSYKLPELSELDAAKLMSCTEAIKNVIGDSIPESELNRKIMEFNFNTEAVLNSISNDKVTKNEKDKKGAVEKNIAGAQAAGNKSRLPKVVPQIARPTLKIVSVGSKNIVKGFDLSKTENSDLTTPRSQSPASERNSPDPSSREDSNCKGGKETTVAALANKSDTSRNQSPVTPEPEVVPRVRTIEEKRDALAIYKSKREGCKEQLHLIVVGHVDAGKSTLLGKMLYDLGQVSQRLIHKYQQESKKIGKQSFAFAWVLDETSDERERGITMDVGHSKFQTNSKFITLLDAPGHRDFIPNMIMGATQADVALLVIDASRGEFETGFDKGGQTREHALLLRSLGVNQIGVVVNKLDTVEWSKQRYNEIVSKIGAFLKQLGFRDAVTYIPCSGLKGENIVKNASSPGLTSWYTGPTLLEVIDNFKCPERPVDKPFRFSVNDVFNNFSSGFCISGHMETGMVAVGDKVIVMPRKERAVVKGIQIDEMNVPYGFAGDQVSLILSGIDQQDISIGDIICSPHKPVPVASRFQAHVVVFDIKMPLTNGMPVVLHQQSLVEPATIRKLVAQLHRSTGEVTKKRPRCLLKNSSAIIEVTTQRPICIELHKDVKQLGRITLRVGGATVAAGLVTKIK